MGRGKLKRKRKQAQKRDRRKGMGRTVRFVLANSPVKYKGFKNKYAYQSNIYNLIYKNAVIANVNFRASSITKCNFRSATLIGVDFIYANLKKTSFKDATLKDVIFFGCKMKDVDFTNTIFDNVRFINTNFNESKNFTYNDETMKSYSKYPMLELSDELTKILYDLSNDPGIYKYHTLHVNRKKVNMWIINLLLQDYTQSQLARGLRSILNRRQSNKEFFTVYSIRMHLNNYLKIC
ncbi:pentapeptide repeat-containing protein [Paenibacillus sp. sgz302251]|uniref:pentapeptide repeat-containing protein n=1 Tax=Paenibacillus sp. sgz302251 TaxID=3414493 RepID=UPI003C79D340